ncbi:hypothetical protein U1Q18_011175 [Sarracenia purpurea var. burkii]
MQVLSGVSLLVYIPRLDPYPGYIPMSNESFNDTEYEALLGGEHVCPKRQANIFSSSRFVGLKNLKGQNPGFYVP